jgi:flavin-dependent dehydrogenase
VISADVVVVGGGPAGAWCARALALGGARVVVLHHEFGHRSTVELLSGRTRWYLRELAVAGVDVRETISLWHGDHLVRRDAFFDPYGPGLAVERRELDAATREAATRAGAMVIAHRALSVEQRAGRWTIDALVEAEHLVLASGRQHPGPQRAALVAMKQTVSFARYPDRGAGGLCIERLPTGWLYSLPVPRGGRFVGICSSSLLSVDQTLSASQLERGLAGRAASETWHGVAVIRIFEKVAGPNWIAIGNAAFQPDPLCGEGLWFALETAREAVAVILGTADSDSFGRRVGLLVQDHMTSRERILAAA